MPRSSSISSLIHPCCQMLVLHIWTNTGCKWNSSPKYSKVANHRIYSW